MSIINIADVIGNPFDGVKGTAVCVIADSINKHNGVRVSTIAIKMPWCITPEPLRHRVFSFCSASSRAIPVTKMIQNVKEDMFIPEVWHYNQPGMQGFRDMSDEDKDLMQAYYRGIGFITLDHVEEMLASNPHKQNLNILLMPYMYCTLIMTGTRWKNFFALRRHPAARYELRHVADLSIEALYQSTPQVKDEFNEIGGYRSVEQLYHGMHLPFIGESDFTDIWYRLSQLPPSDRIDVLTKISAARCARVSYVNFDSHKRDLQKDIDLAEQLISAVPAHASPFEHQAVAVNVNTEYTSGNLHGWHQMRSSLIELDNEPYIYKDMVISW